MRAGRRPEQRNRKIGTAAAGHGQANRMTVPDVNPDGRSFSEKLGPHDDVDFVVQEKDLNALAAILKSMRF